MGTIKMAIGAGLVAMIILMGCGGGSDAGDGNTTSGADGSSSSVASAGDTNLSGQLVTESLRPVIDETALIRANNALDSDLFTGLDEAGENLFYSPFSIFTALSMTYAGAAGNTKAQFERVMHYDANLSVHEAFASLLAKDAHAYNTFSIANSLWPQTGYPFKEDFIYTVFNGYYSELNYMDYIHDFENARLAINDWVKQKTQQKIVDLIPQGALNAATRLVLVNALYFKGTWEYEFDKAQTDKQPFHLMDGSVAESDMMQTDVNASYFENSLFKAIELPYKADEFSMLIFLPKVKEDMAAMKTALFKNDTFETYRAQMRMETGIHVSIPKFKMKWGTKSLKPLLKHLGMTDAFSPKGADFTGMWYRQGDENLYIGDVLHQAFIEVNEEGAEAAAATAVIINDTSSVDFEPTSFTADHPFVFFIIDNKTGMTVFTGKVENPAVQ